jgi:glycosyltransferase involved in cell wall biosynthesis
MTRRRDVLYCEGPGDIVAAYKQWKRGADFTSETSVTFSGQLFDMCRAENLSVYALSYCARAETIIDDGATVKNMPRWNIRIPKIGYELTVAIYALRLLLLAWAVRPKIIFIASGVTDWAYLPLLRLSGAKIVPFMHNTLWPEGFRPTWIGAKLRQAVYLFVWRWCVWQTLGVSPTCARQVHSIAGHVPVTVFKPSFPAASFRDIPSPRSHDTGPFRVMFAGRIEENKGVFDVLSIAEKLPRGEFEFSLCGNGSALAQITEEIEARDLRDTVKTFGKLARPALLARYLDAHVVIVPTRSTFEEGFAMVVAEALLLLRPVISSAVVPAAEVLQPAVCVVPTDSVDGYVAELTKMAGNQEYYSYRVEAARRLRPFILDDSTSFFAALRATARRLSATPSKAAESSEENA